MAQWARESSTSFKKTLWSQMGSRAEPPVANAKGDQHGMEQHSGVRSSAVSAVVWSLPQLYLETGGLPPSGSFDKCLDIPDTNCGICPGPYLWVVPLCRHGRSNHMCRYLSCVSSPDVSALTEVVFLLNQSVMADWQPSWLT